MRLILSIALAVAISGLATALDDAKPSIAERFKALQKEYQVSQQALAKEYQATTDAKEKAAVMEKLRNHAPKFADKYLELGASDPENSASLDPLIMALQMGRDKAAAKKAGELIAEYQLSNPKVKSSMPMLANAGEAGKKLLKTMYDKLEDKGTKGAALYYLGAGLVEDADFPTTDVSPSPEKQVAAMKEAETLLKKAIKEFGDVELPATRGETKTVGKAAECQLFFINNLTIGKVMPDAVVENLEGKKVKISDMRGKVVALDIWATWCGPCRAMIPHERELVTRMKDKPFVLISLSADDKKETLTQFLEKEPMPWTHWWNGSAKGAAIEQYHVRFYPTIYILDEKGLIRFKHVRGEAMDNAVETLLKEIKLKG